MAVDRQAKWIAKYGESKAVKKWLADNPPPADFAGTPQEYAYQEMPDDPIDDPIEPSDDDQPLDARYVSRQEHDALRDQVARTVKGFNRALKRSRERSREGANPPATPPASEPPTPTPEAPARPRRGVGSLLSPL